MGRPKSKYTDIRDFPLEILLKRFEKKYIPDPNSGCWLWIGSATAKGYGIMGAANCKNMQATAVSCLLFKKQHVKKGTDVCHKCDTPSCVNPEHLFLGTRRQNMQDAKAKGRLRQGHLPGEKNGMSKLTELQVKKIIKLLHKKSNSELAHRFNVSEGTIWFIRKGMSWAYLERPKNYPRRKIQNRRPRSSS